MDNKKHTGPVVDRLKAADGSIIDVYDDSEVTCPYHNVTRLWGDLDAIQQLCVEEGICATDHCLIAEVVEKN